MLSQLLGCSTLNRVLPFRRSPYLRTPKPSGKVAVIAPSRALKVKKLFCNFVQQNSKYWSIFYQADPALVVKINLFELKGLHDQNMDTWTK